jgi:hypothetical protein
VAGTSQTCDGIQWSPSRVGQIQQTFRQIWVASGKQPHNYGKSQFLMGKSTISMANFNSYVKLPEGSSQFGMMQLSP